MVFVALRSRKSKSAHPGRGTARTLLAILTALAAVSLVAAGCTDAVDDSAQDSSGEAAEGSSGETDGDTGDTDGTEELAFRERRTPDPNNIPDVEPPDLIAPDEVLYSESEEELRAQLLEAAAAPDVAILDVAGIKDDGPTAEEIAAWGDGNHRTASGELIILDELASLACANVEMALTAMDEGDMVTAAEQTKTAAQRAGDSNVETFPEWGEELTAGVDESGDEPTVDPLPLIGLLAACVDGGHEL